MKISILCNDLSGAAAGRAFILGRALEVNYDVEIIGPIFRSGVWYPVRNEFNFKMVKGFYGPLFPVTIKELIKQIDGEIVYAVKPHLSSYGIALLMKILYGFPVILDIDDWEIGFAMNSGYIWMLAALPKNLLNPNGYPYDFVLEKLIKKADALTTVSTFLQKKFGGTIIPHGRDTDFLDPEKYDGELNKMKHGLTGKKVILFLGRPGPQKGIQDVAEAISRIGDKDIRFVIAGDTNDKFARGIYNAFSSFVRLMGFQPFGTIPELLAMADLVVLAQRKQPGTFGQIPAKLFDAMAMAKPIIATNVSDLPSILKDCGVIVEPEDIDSLANEIKNLLEDKERATGLGRKAREKCKQHYSIKVMQKRLCRIIDNLV